MTGDPFDIMMKFFAHGSCYFTRSEIFDMANEVQFENQHRSHSSSFRSNTNSRRNAIEEEFLATREVKGEFHRVGEREKNYNGIEQIYAQSHFQL